jgi:pimeloyl-ACP methyl ester carboxylesterase
MVQFSWAAGTPIERIPLSMRINSVPILGRLVRALPPNERSVRAVFRMIGHGPGLASGSISDEEIAAYLALLRYTDTTRHDLAVGPVLMSPVGGLERFLLPERFLRSIAIPTLFIWGERDPFGGPDVARRLVALIPNAELELLPAGHAPWLDDLERCATLSTGFLRSA